MPTSWLPGEPKQRFRRSHAQSVWRGGLAGPRDWRMETPRGRWPKQRVLA